MPPPDLLVVALSVLSCVDQPTTIRGAAVEALVSALSEGVPLPPGAVRHIWWFWVSSPTRRALRSAWLVGALDDPIIRAEATELLLSPGAEGDLRDLAVDVLIGDGHRGHLGEDLLGTLVDRASTEALAREAARLLDVAHAARGLPADLLLTIRERFASASIAGIREVSIAIDSLVVPPDLGFVERMLGDPDADVRAAMANALGLDHPGRALARAAIERRLQVEAHPRARSSLLRAEATILEELDVGPIGRRGRRR